MATMHEQTGNPVSDDAMSTPLQLFDLQGRVVLVTGASSGLGEAFCSWYWSLGARVVAVARREDRLRALAERHPGLAVMAVDIADESRLDGLIDFIGHTFGQLDVVVNNAGISDGPRAALDQSGSDFRRVIEVNLSSCFSLSTRAARMMSATGSGAIVNVSSIYGLVASSPMMQAGYVSSKAGLLGLTRELAAQWAPLGIRVNAIAPGYFRTEMTSPMFENDHRGVEFIRRNTMLEREGEVPELFGALLLLSSDAGSYITGQAVVVDGGWSAR